MVIIDSGIDVDHAVISQRLLLGHDLSTDGDNDIQDRFNHGSPIASVIAGRGVPDLFSGGLAEQVNVISLQILDNEDNQTEIDQIQFALAWVIQNAEAFNIAAVNFSIGPPLDASKPVSGSQFNRAFSQTGNSDTADEFQMLARMGVTVVVAAGNEYNAGLPYRQNIGPALTPKKVSGTMLQMKTQSPLAHCHQQYADVIFKPG